MKKTKIVSTIGPASEDKEVLRELFLNGLNVARLNFSHGSHPEHKAKIETIKELREELDLPIAIMLDTKGPEIRLGSFSLDEVYLEPGTKYTLTVREDVLGNEKIASVSYKSLADDIVIGDRILIDDGLVELLVEEIVNKEDIVCKVLNGGTIKGQKGINVPNVDINLPAITEKDISDIKFGIENGVDFIAASFIRKDSDILAIREILEENGGEDIHIISKIENREGVNNIDSIIESSDGIMVARGDLGVEIETEEIPIIQKRIISKCNMAGKPVITATQMLDSMMRNPRPTRAEVTDVANAILDGSDAIMLSGETAAGKYPVEAVKTMFNIARTMERSPEYRKKLEDREYSKSISTTNAISKATCTTAKDLEASAIITATSSGYTARAVSKYRPDAKIIAVTDREDVRRKLSLVWGVVPIKSSKSTDTDEIIEKSIQAALDTNNVDEGDLVVITAGIPVGVSGTTNLLKVHTIGTVIGDGVGIGDRSVAGEAFIVENIEELERNFKEGDILLARFTNKDMVEFMQKARAIVVEEGGLTSHAAIVGLNLGVPTVVGVKDITKIVEAGEKITVDSRAGLIYKGEARVL